MLIFSAFVRYCLVIGYVEALKINLREVCGANSFRCTIADCSDEPVGIDNTASKYLFTEVVFRNCYTPTIPTFLFSSTPKLERLLMYKCSMKSIQQRNFNEASHLRSLYLPNNRLTELAEKIFANLSVVEEIRLSGNHISLIHPKAFAGLTQLRILELSNNKIHELASSVFSNLSSLEYIDLSFNDLEVMDSKIFATNLGLKTVLLSNNNFAMFESNSLAHLPHLQTLDISYNAINSIRLQSVDTLRAQSSQLRSCVINGSVIRVRASNNQLGSISITDKASVKEIDLHSNQLDSLSDFHGMLNLQKLDISKNSVHSLNSTSTSLLLDLPSLQSLNLAYCQLHALTLENFLLLGKLSHLDLAYNSLHAFDASVFEPLVSLEKIYFEGNRLHSFDYETFMRDHANVKEMGIFGNNWAQTYLKKMSDVLKVNDVKLIIRFNLNEASEMISLQTTSHPHHTVHAKTLEQGAVDGGSHSPGVNNRDILMIVTLCLVLIILFLQLFRILKDENMFTFCSQSVRRTNRPRRLDEEESEPL